MEEQTLSHCFFLIFNFPANAKQAKDSITASFIEYNMKVEGLEPLYTYAEDYLKDENLTKYHPISRIRVNIPRDKDGNDFSTGYCFISNFEESEIVDKQIYDNKTGVNMRIVPYRMVGKQLLSATERLTKPRYSIERCWLKAPKNQNNCCLDTLVTSLSKNVQISDLCDLVRNYIPDHVLKKFDDKNEKYPFIKKIKKSPYNKFFVYFETEEDACTVCNMLRKYEIHVTRKDGKKLTYNGIFFYDKD